MCKHMRLSPKNDLTTILSLRPLLFFFFFSLSLVHVYIALYILNSCLSPLCCLCVCEKKLSSIWDLGLCTEFLRVLHAALVHPGQLWLFSFLTNILSKDILMPHITCLLIVALIIFSLSSRKDFKT